MKVMVYAAAAALFLASSAAQATTLRFEFDTSSSLARTFNMNSWSQNSAGYYPGVITTATGLDSTVLGHIDIDTSGTTPALDDFSLAVTVPHGISSSLGNPNYTTDYFSSITLTPGAGASHSFEGGNYLHITQTFLFSPYFGPFLAGGWSSPYYNDTDTSEYLFKTTVVFAPIVGAGPGGADSWRVYSTSVACAESNLGIASCNGFYGQNGGNWYGGDGAASAISVVTDPGNGEPGGNGSASVVPLPAGLPLMAGAFGVLGLLRRRNKSA